MARTANAKLVASSQTLREEFRSPLYRQIFLILRNKIVEGEYRDGSFLPSELEIANAFAVSRITAKRALNELAEAGLAVRQRGCGTRVRYRSGGTQVAGSVDSLIDSLRANARNLTNVLSFDYVPASSEVASVLQLAPESTVQRAVRVSTRDGAPYSRLTTFVPEALGRHWTADELRTNALVILLERAGSPVAYAEQAISATLADNERAAALEVSLGSPLLRVVRTAYTAERRPSEYLIALYPPDRYQFLMSLTRDADAGDWR